MLFGEASAQDCSALQCLDLRQDDSKKRASEILLKKLVTYLPPSPKIKHGRPLLPLSIYIGSNAFFEANFD